MTYDQADGMVVMGPLAVRPTPHAYDLCAQHVERFTAPVGWQLIRLHTQFDPAPPAVSDIEALVDTVRTVAEHSLHSESSTATQAELELVVQEATRNFTPSEPPVEEDRHQATVTELGPYLK